jgi:hypothetical protein
MGLVVLVLSVVGVVSVGAMMYVGYDDHTEFTGGQIRSYDKRPDVKWSADLGGLQPQLGAQLSVVDSVGSTWLVRSTANQDNVFATLDADSGKRTAAPAIDAGFGECALADSGVIGCSIQSPLDNRPDGFYSTGDGGELGPRHDAPSATQVAAQGDDFLLANNIENTVTRITPDGKTVWHREFDSAPTLTTTDGSVIVQTASARTYLIDPANGDERYSCASCTATAYADGIAVQQNGNNRSVDFYRLNGSLVTSAERQELLHGPSALPVVTAASGTGELPAVQGTFVGYDPSRKTALWKASAPQLSTAAAITCGDIAMLRKFDDSRLILELRSGKQLGKVLGPDSTDPRHDVRGLQCVGANSSRMVFADGSGLLTAFNTRTGRVAWETPDELGGAPAIVDGYLTIVANGVLTVLAPD